MDDEDPDVHPAGRSSAGAGGRGMVGDPLPIRRALRNWPLRANNRRSDPISVIPSIVWTAAAFLSLPFHSEQERLMQSTLRLLSLAGLLAMGAATAMAANNDPGGNLNSQSTTGVQTGSQQVPSPATGSSQYVTGKSAQSSGYPGGVGPTGSHDPDATNPNRSSPSGGGGAQDSGGANGTSSSR